MQVFDILINENYLCGLMRKPVSCLSYRPLRSAHRFDLLVSRTRIEFTIILCESFLQAIIGLQLDSYPVSQPNYSQLLQINFYSASATKANGCSMHFVSVK